MSSLSELLLKFAYNRGYAVYSSDPEGLASRFPVQRISWDRRAIHMTYPSAEEYFKRGAELVSLQSPQFQGDPAKILKCSPSRKAILRYLLQDRRVIGQEFLMELDLSYLKNHNAFHKMVNNPVLGQIKTPSQIYESLLDGPVKQRPVPPPSSGKVGMPLVTAAVPAPIKADPLIALRREIKDFLRRGG